MEDFINASNRAQTTDDLFRSYKKAMKKLGFDRIIFSLMTDHVIIQRRAGHGIMLNYPKAWMRHYADKNYEIIDPVRRHMYMSHACFTWKAITRLPTMTEDQRGFMKASNDADLHDGIGIPLRGPRGAIAGIGAASSSGGIDLENKNLLSRVSLMAQQFYTVFRCSHHSSAFRGQRGLGPHGGFGGGAG